MTRKPFDITNNVDLKTCKGAEPLTQESLEASIKAMRKVMMKPPARIKKVRCGSCHRWQSFSMCLVVRGRFVCPDIKCWRKAFEAAQRRHWL